MAAWVSRIRARLWRFVVQQQGGTVAVASGLAVIGMAQEFGGEASCMSHMRPDSSPLQDSSLQLAAPHVSLRVN